MLARRDFETLTAAAIARAGIPAMRGPQGTPWVGCYRAHGLVDSE